MILHGPRGFVCIYFLLVVVHRYSRCVPSMKRSRVGGFERSKLDICDIVCVVHLAKERELEFNKIQDEDKIRRIYAKERRTGCWA